MIFLKINWWSISLISRTWDQWTVFERKSRSQNSISEAMIMSMSINHNNKGTAMVWVWTDSIIRPRPRLIKIARESLEKFSNEYKKCQHKDFIVLEKKQIFYSIPETTHQKEKAKAFLQLMFLIRGKKLAIGINLMQFSRSIDLRWSLIACSSLANSSIMSGISHQEKHTR